MSTEIDRLTEEVRSEMARARRRSSASSQAEESHQEP
jgi:hypothetical protein